MNAYLYKEYKKFKNNKIFLNFLLDNIIAEGYKNNNIIIKGSSNISIEQFSRYSILIYLDDYYRLFSLGSYLKVSPNFIHPDDNILDREQNLIMFLNKTLEIWNRKQKINKLLNS